MTTSGTNTFNLNIEECVEKAYRLIGSEITSGEELKQARRSLDLLLIEMQNKGHPFAKLEKVSQTLTEGDADYLLDTSVLDVLEMTVKRGGTETAVERVPLFEYHKIPTKSQKGKPSLYALDRNRTQVTVYLYSTPENSTDTIEMWTLKRVHDSGAYTNNIDLSIRYLPCVIFGLAYYLSMEKPNFPQGKRQELKAQYLELLGEANHEDRERASFRVLPPNYYRG